jgi:hypothetical protein
LSQKTDVGLQFSDGLQMETHIFSHTIEQISIIGFRIFHEILIPEAQRRHPSKPNSFIL